MSNALNKMASVFEQLSRKGSAHSAFNDLLDFTLIPYRYYPTGEELKAAHEKLVSWPDKELITSFLTAMADLQPEGFRDPIGEFYMQHISHGHLGQYFTPENITDFMAIASVGDHSEPGQTVLDPACGSGRTLLATAKINRHLRFYGADLDSTCCKMALTNMLVNSLTGEIAHMNSITNEFYRGYRFQTKLIDGCHYPYFV
jgi:type I restriction-modification system DNA methylase subunit